MRLARRILKPLSIGLAAVGILVGTIGGTEAQSAPSDPRDFTPDRWRLLTMPGEATAGVRGEDADDMMLFTCTESHRSVSLSIHPAEQGFSETAHATLAFDGGTPVDAEIPLMNVVGNILFLLVDRDQHFRAVTDKFMTAASVEVAIVQARAVHSRHKFTLKGAADTVTPVLKLCGR
jgi:hypothetical protein